MQMSQSLKAGLALFVSHCLFLSLSAPSSLRLSLPLPLSLFLCRSAYIFMWEEIVYLRTAASSVLSMFLTRMHAHRHTHAHTYKHTHTHKAWAREREEYIRITHCGLCLNQPSVLRGRSKDYL
jgi:hypothetical protein